MSEAADVPRGATGVERDPAPTAGAQRARHSALLPLIESVRSLAFLLVIALFIVTFIIQPFRIPSESMERTLLVGDFLLVNKAVYGPTGDFGWLLPYRQVQRGDIVVFHFPDNPPEYVVKRVIGVPGDRIHLKNGVVYRNGEALKEQYVVKEPAWPDSFRDNFPSDTYSDPGMDVRWWEQMRQDEKGDDLVVPAGEYFVMGDNRNHSRDSRYWGFVPRGNIEGRPFIIYFSLRHASTTDVTQLAAPGAAAQAIGQQDGRLKHEGTLEKIVDFARWGRILRVVR